MRRAEVRSLVDEGDARAVKLLENQGSATPDPQSPDLESRYLLAVGYEGLQRYADALSAIGPVVDRASGTLKAEAQLTQASSLFALKRYAEAIPPFEAFLAARPANAAPVPKTPATKTPSPKTPAQEAAAETEAKAIGSLAISPGACQTARRGEGALCRTGPKYSDHPLWLPTTERLAEAAYDAGDTAWSAELSRGGWLPQTARRNPS